MFRSEITVFVDRKSMQEPGGNCQWTSCLKQHVKGNLGSACLLPWLYVLHTSSALCRRSLKAAIPVFSWNNKCILILEQMPHFTPSAVPSSPRFSLEFVEIAFQMQPGSWVDLMELNCHVYYICRVEGTAAWISKSIRHYQARYHDISMFQYNANITIRLISLSQKRESNRVWRSQS